MTDSQRTKIIEAARQHLGVPYKYGATPEEAPRHFDCSSFTQYCFAQAGIVLPRSTILQAEDSSGAPVEYMPSLEGLMPGDLVFVHGVRGHYSPRYPQGIGHVGIYTGNNAVIHAASRRVSEYPRVAEEGKVEEMDLAVFIEKLKPLVVVKRW